MTQIKNSFFHLSGKKKTKLEKETSFGREKGAVLEGKKSCPELTGSWRSLSPVVDVEKCVGCGICVDFCPESTIELKEKKKQKKAVVDYDFCKGCGICSQVCPFRAIKMKNK